MQLIIDRGNTVWKIAVFDNDQLISLEKKNQISTVFFEDLFKQFNFEAGIISSVSLVDDDIIALLKDKMKFIELTHQTKLPIKLNYNTPETLGKDRIAGAVGAYSQWGEENCLIIDAGTCITYDILLKGGIYSGGSISPGINIRFKALNNFTGKLPLIESKEINYFTGKSTEESILSGVLKGICFEIDGFINHYHEEIKPLKIIFTGGDALYFDKNLKNSIFADSNLVLKGLKEILKYNV